MVRLRLLLLVVLGALVACHALSECEELYSSEYCARLAKGNATPAPSSQSPAGSDDKSRIDCTRICYEEASNACGAMRGVIRERALAVRDAVNSAATTASAQSGTPPLSFKITLALGPAGKSALQELTQLPPLKDIAPLLGRISADTTILGVRGDGDSSHVPGECFAIEGWTTNSALLTFCAVVCFGAGVLVGVLMRCPSGSTSAEAAGADSSDAAVKPEPSTAGASTDAGDRKSSAPSAQGAKNRHGKGARVKLELGASKPRQQQQSQQTVAASADAKRRSDRRKWSKLAVLAVASFFAAVFALDVLSNWSTQALNAYTNSLIISAAPPAGCESLLGSTTGATSTQSWWLRAQVAWADVRSADHPCLKYVRHKVQTESRFGSVMAALGAVKWSQGVHEALGHLSFGWLPVLANYIGTSVYNLYNQLPRALVWVAGPFLLAFLLVYFVWRMLCRRNVLLRAHHPLLGTVQAAVFDNGQLAPSGAADRFIAGQQQMLLGTGSGSGSGGAHSQQLLEQPRDSERKNAVPRLQAPSRAESSGGGRKAAKRPALAAPAPAPALAGPVIEEVEDDAAASLPALEAVPSAAETLAAAAADVAGDSSAAASPAQSDDEGGDADGDDSVEASDSAQAAPAVTVGAGAGAGASGAAGHKSSRKKSKKRKQKAADMSRSL